MLRRSAQSNLRSVATSRQFPTQILKSNAPLSIHHLNHALQEMSVCGLDMKFKDYNALLNECVKHKSLTGGQRVHTHMIKTHYLPPLFLRTRLIVLYSQCRALDDALMVFDEMPVKNVVSWTALISGYSKWGFYSHALTLFVQMLRSGTDANEFTFATVINSCKGASSFEYGRQIHALLAKTPFEFHTYVGSSLVDLYAKAGKIHEARIIFKELPQRDSVSCTAIISGYAQLGLDKETLDLFCTLQSEGMISNYVTYATLLTALSGLAAFEYGRQVHGHVLRSELSHYTVVENSLIDMYSKCGYLSCARRIFDNMAETSVVSWNAMLGGYCKHGIGEGVVELYKRMIEENKIRPDGATLLIVLSGCSHGGMDDTGLKLFYEMAAKYGADLGVEHYGCVVDMLGRAGQLGRALQFIKEMPMEPNAAIWGSLLGACRAHHNVEVGKIAGDHLLEMEPENAANYVILCNILASDGRWDEVRKMRELMKDKDVVKEAGKSWMELDQTKL